MTTNMVYKGPQLHVDVHSHHRRSSRRVPLRALPIALATVTMLCTALLCIVLSEVSFNTIIDDLTTLHDESFSALYNTSLESVRRLNLELMKSLVKPAKLYVTAVVEDSEALSARLRQTLEAHFTLSNATERVLTMSPAELSEWLRDAVQMFGVTSLKDRAASQLFFATTSGVLVGTARAPPTIVDLLPSVAGTIFAFSADGSTWGSHSGDPGVYAPTDQYTHICRIDDLFQCHYDIGGHRVPSAVSLDMRPLVTYAIARQQNATSEKLSQDVFLTPILESSDFLVSHGLTLVHNGIGGANVIGAAFASFEVDTVSKFLRTLELADDQRIFVVVEGEPFRKMNDAIIGPNSSSAVGTLVGASHGRWSDLVVGVSSISGRTSIVPQRILARESDDSIIASAAAYVDTAFNGHWPRATELLEFTDNVTKVGHFFFSERLKTRSGLCWRIVTTYPVHLVSGAISEQHANLRLRDDERQDDSERSRRGTMILMYVLLSCLLVLMIVAALIMTVRASYRLFQLHDAMERVAVLDLENIEINLDDPTLIISRIREVASMQLSFISMVRNLREFRAFVPQAVLIPNESFASFPPASPSIASSAKAHLLNMDDNDLVSEAELSERGTPSHPLTDTFPSDNATSNNNNNPPLLFLSGSRPASAFSNVTANTPRGAGTATPRMKRANSSDPDSAPNHHERMSRLREIGFRPFSTSVISASAPQLDIALFPTSEDGGALHQSTQDFVTRVLEAIDMSEGVVVTVTADKIVGSWNAFRPCIDHEHHSVKAAVLLRQRLDERGSSGHHNTRHSSLRSSRLVLAAGSVYVGVVGSSKVRSPVIHGAPIDMLDALATLSDAIKCGILASESIANRARSRFEVIPIDCVSLSTSLGSDLSHTVYEVLPVLPTASELRVFDELCREYTSAFSAMLSMDFDAAVNHFANHLMSHGDELATKHIYHALRLSRLCVMHRDAVVNADDPNQLAVPLVRHRGGWALPEADAEYVQLSPDLFGKYSELRRTSMAPPSMLHRNDNDDLSDATVEEFATVLLPNTTVELRSRVAEVREQHKLTRNSSSSSGGSLASTLSSVQGFKKVGSAPKRSPPVLMSPGGTTIAPPDQSSSPMRRVKSNLFTQDPEGTFQTTSGVTYYRSGKVLGRGATSEVRLAMSDDGALVALKCCAIQMNGMSATDKLRAKAREDEMDTIIDEVNMLSTLRHDNVVAYLGAAVVARELVIVTEYVSGGSLANTLETFGRIPPRSLRRYLRDTLHGLVYLHKNNIAHRDIKPHNVLLMIDGQCKLTDFGAAAHLKRVRGADDTTDCDSDHTMDSDVVGTPSYMSPEACTGNATKASDIWSFAIMAAELMTGELPYTTEQRGMPFWRFVYNLSRDAEFMPVLDEAMIGDSVAVAFLRQCLVRDETLRPTAAGLLLHPFLM